MENNIQKIQTVQYSKIDDNTLQVITPQPQPEPVVATYDRTFIENQLVAIQAQLDDYTSARQAELDECNNILSEMDAQGIVAKPIDVVQTDAIE